MRVGIISQLWIELITEKRISCCDLAEIFEVTEKINIMNTEIYFSRIGLIHRKRLFQRIVFQLRKSRVDIENETKE